MRVLVVDDEELARERLTRFISEMEEFDVVGEAASGFDALKYNEANPADIILLDIRMPGMDGLEAARHFADMAQPPAVIFTTAYGDHALEAFNAHAMGYLLKPIRRERLQEAMNKASRLTRAQLAILDSDEERASKPARSQICARVRGNLELISIDDIYFFQADQKYVSVRHVGGEVLIEEPLKHLEQEFTSRFVRIHRNALAAINHLGGLEKSKEGRHLLTFKECDDRLEISRRHLAEVRALLKQL